MKTDEFTNLEIWLENQRLWQTSDGYFIGPAFPGAQKVIAKEPTFNPADTTQSLLICRARRGALVEEGKSISTS